MSCHQLERRLLRHLHGTKIHRHLTSIHAQILRHCLVHSNLLLSQFIVTCSSLNCFHYAHLIFSTFLNPNILLFNSIIKSHSLNPPTSGCSFHVFSLMRSRGIAPDQFTFPPLIKSCANLCDLKLGGGVHGVTVTNGFCSNERIGTGIIEIYTNCGYMEGATKLFDEMSNKEVITWNLLIHGFCKWGEVDRGMSIFRRMGEKSVVSWNLMISSLAKSRKWKESLGIFLEMRDKGFEPDEATVVSIFPVCATLGEADVGKLLHRYVESKGILEEYVSVGNSLVDFYCKCGDLDTAREVFRGIKSKNVVSWNAMISGLALNGKGEIGIELYEEMKRGKVKPNESTFVSVLACCAHAGLVERGRVLFDSMSADYQIEPRLEHYGCMVDILGRGGCVEEAYKLIRNMRMKPNAALWGSLLSACRVHGDIKLAECAVKELINIEPWNSGNYVLLSNIYAEGSRWDEVEKVRVAMKDNKVNKAPGQSYFE